MTRLRELLGTPITLPAWALLMLLAVGTWCWVEAVLR